MIGNDVLINVLYEIASGVLCSLCVYLLPVYRISLNVCDIYEEV
jgi:hypothetical protein